MRSASEAGLSQRMREIRGKRMATPERWRGERLSPSKAISSTSPWPGSAIVFDVAKGVLEQVAGKHAVFDIVTRAEEGKSTQISVDCNFGELGDCGRKRYEVGYEKGEFLFDIELPNKAPGAEGTIAINSDIDNGGKAIDVYEIKVSIGE